MFASLLALADETLVPPSQVPDELVTPGWVGFIAMLFIGLVVLVVVIDMVRRVRRVTYRAEIGEKLAAEQAALASKDASPEH